MENREDFEIDESLYSRQLYVVGKEAMKKMMGSKILVIGLDGLGQEVAKNICLAGVNKMLLFDDQIVMEEDLCTGFYLKECDIGKRRDLCVLERLRALNKYVSVDVVENISRFVGYDVVVGCNKGYVEQMELNKMARRNGSKFIGCQSRGLFSQVFCDFGEEFVCLDRTGEIPATGMINDITEDGVMTVVSGQQHNLEDFDVIKITQNEAYEGKYFRVRVLSSTQVSLQMVDDVRIFENTDSDFKQGIFSKASGGDFEQLKKPLRMKFKSLEETIDNPDILGVNSEVEERCLIIHKCFVVLGECSLSSNSSSSMGEFLGFFSEKYGDPFEFEKLIRSFVEQSSGMLMPMCSVVGGFVAQEVLKAISGKFTPLHQFFYFDAIDVIPDGLKRDKDLALNGRYGPMIRSLGKEAVEKLFRSNIFVCGAGAIGSEHLKNMVMCGIGCWGKIHVTDMDAIEKSNLNRQFLFKSCDISKMKAEVAVREAAKLNEDFLRASEMVAVNFSDISDTKNGEKEQYTRKNLIHYNLKVGKETESVFSDEFLKPLDVVSMALDNLDTRMYIDDRCVLNRKFMVDAGTSGTKGNVQVIIPQHTESYASSRDPPEKTIPLCTVKNFPHAIDHVIEWATSEFRLRFHDHICLIKDHLDRKEFVEVKDESDSYKEDDTEEKTVDCDRKFVEEIMRNFPTDTDCCIKNAVLLFVELFHTSIRGMITAFPLDSKTEDGQPFWTPPKRPPTTINFDIKDSLHVLFVQSVANIFSCNFGIGKIVSREMVLDFLKNEMFVEEYSMESPAVENTSDSRDLENMVVSSSILHPSLFEKDDDSNSHVDFLYAAANLRARNYKIKEVDRLTVKGIAGKITPAIATTTAIVSGLAVLEMIKYILGVNHTKHKNSFLNLALPFFANTDPVEPRRQLYRGVDGQEYTFTLWSKLEYKNAKLGTILRAFEIQFGKKISMIVADSSLIYWDFDSKYAENLDKVVSELVNSKPGQHFISLDILTEDNDDTFPKMVLVLD